MQKAIFIAQIVVSVLLVVAILMQQRGSGVSAVFGGGGQAYRTKRGLEKGLFTASIVLIVLFIIIGVLNLVVSS